MGRVEQVLPALSHHFHLSPSDVWGLTQGEFVAYMNALKQLNNELGR